jgi:GNAT superfamily N-acetyltransferase
MKADTITIACEPWTREFWAEVEPLAREHYLELAHYQDIPLDVDVERYLAMEAAGRMRAYVARDAGRIIGYAWFFVAPNAHYNGSLQAVQDVLYVDPALRGGAIGRKLVQFCEDALRAEGVQAVYHHAKVAHEPLQILLSHMGYEAVDIIFAKRLDRTEG